MSATAKCYRRFISSIADNSAAGYTSYLATDPGAVLNNNLYECYEEAESAFLPQGPNGGYYVDATTGITAFYKYIPFVEEEQPPFNPGLYTDTFFWYSNLFTSVFFVFTQPVQMLFMYN